MTQREWLDLAKQWERKGKEAERRGDLVQAEYCWTKAQACRSNSVYGTDDE